MSGTYVLYAGPLVGSTYTRCQSATYLNFQNVRGRITYAEHISPPPRPSRPPQSASPNVAIRIDVRQHILDSGLAHGVYTARKLAKHTLLTIAAQPGRGGCETLGADGAADAGGAGAGAVGVEVLMHLRMSAWASCVLETRRTW